MKPVQILLIEDNEVDILLTTEALEDSKIINSISVARDGKEALLFLENAMLGQEPIPDLILLDINLPLKSGHEVLEIIKQDSRFKRIPVIMLTTSSSEKDIYMAYQNHANCFITKPVELPDFIQAISQIESFWFQIVSLP